MSANDKQIDGTHYRSGYQHWDALVDLGFGPEYYIGAATKYLSRWRKKSGVRDLRKGQHFIEKLLDILQNNPSFVPQISEVAIENVIHRFANTNGLDAEERVIVQGLMLYRTPGELRWLHQIVDSMIIRTLAATGAHIPRRYAFVAYGAGHETITWRDDLSGEQFTLPVDVPPSQHR